jgi:hypothetical protein
MRVGSGFGGDAATGIDEFDAHSADIEDSASAFHTTFPDDPASAGDAASTVSDCAPGADGADGTAAAAGLGLTRTCSVIRLALGADRHEGGSHRRSNLL